MFPILLASFSATLGAAELRDLRLWDSPEGTRVVFELSESTPHTVFTLNNPPRIVVDLPETSGQKLANQAQGRGAVQHVRAADRADGGIRVVLDMNAAIEPRTVLLDPADAYGHRLVLDLAAVEGADPAAASEPAAAPAPPVEPLIAPVPPTPTPAQPPRKARPIVVAIDAGHGGEDPGARGHGGLLEKHVALAVSRKLAKLVDAQPGYRAVLTRDGDHFVPLRERTNRARKAQADLFVSVHANALHDPKMRGSAVYVVSPRGATSEQNRWLAHRENSADLVGGIEIENKDDELAAVLIDLSQSSTREASFDVGARMLKALGDINHLQKTEVQQAGFMVLKSPDIPSVLVETAFITNAEEEKRLGDPDYQDKIARSLLDGILGYFESYRPRDPGTVAPRDTAAPKLQKVKGEPLAAEKDSAASR